MSYITFQKKLFSLSTLYLLCGAAFLSLESEYVQASSIVIHTSDFIPDSSRAHFNGFELIPHSGNFYTGGAGPYTEDTIQVEQIHSDPGNDIWVTYNATTWAGFAGNYSWYPNGGSDGYTSISLTGGIDFPNGGVGFHYGSGFGSSSTILYELLNNGVTVLSGSAALTACAPCLSSGPNYLGFSGGGFDTIILRDTLLGGGTVTDGTHQALSIDNIETVPEPGTLALVGVGIAVGMRRRRKTRASE